MGRGPSEPPLTASGEPCPLLEFASQQESPILVLGGAHSAAGRAREPVGGAWRRCESASARDRQQRGSVRQQCCPPSSGAEPLSLAESRRPEASPEWEDDEEAEWRLESKTPWPKWR